MKKNKKGFTLLELMIIVVLIGLGLIVVIEALKNSNVYLQKTRQKIIAINLAREGVEQMINIRNTNRLKRAGEKDNARLKVNPSIDEDGNGLVNDEWFGQGNYIIQNTTMSGQQYFYAKSIEKNLIIENGIGGFNNNYSLCETEGIRNACPGEKPQSTEGYFFRQIKGIGLFDKNNGEELKCGNGEDPGCGNSSAKEFRFCSIVEYIGNGVGKVELCSILTNFE